MLLCILLILRRVYWFFLLQVDVPTVFADKVMKATMKHIEIIAKARGKGEKQEEKTHPKIHFT